MGASVSSMGVAATGPAVQAIRNTIRHEGEVMKGTCVPGMNGETFAGGIVSSLRFVVTLPASVLQVDRNAPW